MTLFVRPWFVVLCFPACAVQALSKPVDAVGATVAARDENTPGALEFNSCGLIASPAMRQEDSLTLGHQIAQGRSY